MITKVSVVAIGEDESWLHFVWDLMTGSNAHVQSAIDAESGLRCAIEHSARIVLIDPATPGLDVSETLDRIFRQSPATQMALVAGHQTGDAAILATRIGLSDYKSRFVHLRDFRTQISPVRKPSYPELAN